MGEESEISGNGAITGIKGFAVIVSHHSDPQHSFQFHSGLAAGHRLVGSQQIKHF